MPLTIGGSLGKSESKFKKVLLALSEEKATVLRFISTRFTLTT